MTKVVAVSGGVDSVVLLDTLARSTTEDIVVAHFDHGIRADSAADARFAKGLAALYGCKYEGVREELGAQASEAFARERRYAFLKTVARKYKASVYTAHHNDDVVETIAINLTRGTGWRGLAVMNDPMLVRPLLGMRKQDIYSYALTYGLEWVEDETNASDRYLRNRLRRKLQQLPSGSYSQLSQLRDAQVSLADDITKEGNGILAAHNHQRHIFIMISETVAIELLGLLLTQSGRSATRPQRQVLLHAIKTAKPGTITQVGSGIEVEFGATDFIVKYPS